MDRLKRVCAVLFFIIAMSFAVTSFAAVSYTVHKGDTLKKISKKYNVSVAEIKESNKLNSSRLKPGTKLLLPDTEKNHARKSASHHTASNKTMPGDNDSVVHIVKKGDTLKSISRQYKVSANDIRTANNLKSGKLKAGQQLVITGKRHTPAVYTARRGDTVRKVARLFRMSPGDLMEINGLKANSLKPGQKLYLAKNRTETAESPSEEAIGTEKSSPSVTSARLEEVKELSTSEDVLLDLSLKERLILFARKMLHLPYRFGGTGAFGLDCSAFVQKVYSFIGHDIPRSAREQFNMGEAVDKDELTIGDLVFFRTYASFPSHVGIYMGNNLFIHASSLSKKITIDSLESPYYFRRFIGAKRIIPEDDFDMGSGETSIKVN